MLGVIREQISRVVAGFDQGSSFMWWSVHLTRVIYRTQRLFVSSLPDKKTKNSWKWWEPVKQRQLCVFHHYISCCYCLLKLRRKNKGKSSMPIHCRTKKNVCELQLCDTESILLFTTYIQVILSYSGRLFNNLSDFVWSFQFFLILWHSMPLNDLVEFAFLCPKFCLNYLKIQTIAWQLDLYKVSFSLFGHRVKLFISDSDHIPCNFLLSWNLRVEHSQN